MSKLSESLILIGGLSAPSKMPCYATSLPAQNCHVGAKLAPLPGSVCHECYALRGAYGWPNTRLAMERRQQIVQRLGEDVFFAIQWAEAFAYVLNYRMDKWHPGARIDANYFRWFDSGDLQSDAHLRAIVHVAELTPRVKHWLPTKERRMVTQYQRAHSFTADSGDYPAFPRNLIVRVSAAMFDQRSPVGVTGYASTSHTSKALDGVFSCPARTQGNECGSCRACWEVPSVSYERH